MMRVPKWCGRVPADPPGTSNTRLFVECRAVATSLCPQTRFHVPRRRPPLCAHADHATHPWGTDRVVCVGRPASTRWHTYARSATPLRWRQQRFADFDVDKSVAQHRSVRCTVGMRRCNSMACMAWLYLGSVPWLSTDSPNIGAALAAHQQCAHGSSVPDCGGCRDPRNSDDPCRSSGRCKRLVYKGVV